MTEMEFAERLKRYRKAKNYTQQELADLLGVSNKSVSRWESGNGYPDIVLLGPLARALDVTVDALLCDEPPIRTLNTADWQNLLSFAFAIGGGVLFFLLDLFAPTLVCYLLYLGAMAYGVYLQNRYTYRSRWFCLANLTMNFFVNFVICGFVASAAELLFTQRYFRLYSGEDIPFSSLISSVLGSGSSLSNLAIFLLVRVGPQALAAALLTAITGRIIRVVSAGQRPRLTWNRKLSPWDALPCALALLPPAVLGSLPYALCSGMALPAPKSGICGVGCPYLSCLLFDPGPKRAAGNCTRADPASGLVRHPVAAGGPQLRLVHPQRGDPAC